MRKLIPCEKPQNLDEQYVGNTSILKGHVFIGRYDTDGNYYEHDITADKWYKLVEEFGEINGCPTPE